MTEVHEDCRFWKQRACKNVSTNNCWNTSCPDHKIQKDGCIENRQIPSSKELILLAKHDWKNRQERKGLNDEQSWTSGWIAGFLSERKPNWTKEHDAEIVKKERERVLNELRDWSYTLAVNNSAIAAMMMRVKIDSLRSESRECPR